MILLDDPQQIEDLIRNDRLLLRFSEWEYYFFNVSDVPKDITDEQYNQLLFSSFSEREAKWVFKGGLARIKRMHYTGKIQTFVVCEWKEIVTRVSEWLSMEHDFEE